jgi:biopolymer transport protein ExbD
MKMFNWDETPDLNITPFVDVMLVLLAILMVTTPAVMYQEEIALPQGTTSKTVTKNPDVEIRIDKKRVVYIKDDTFAFKDFADNFILYSKSFNKNSPVYIRADKGLVYGDVMYVLKSVKEAGFSKVALVTDG